MAGLLKMFADMFKSQTTFKKVGDIIQITCKTGLGNIQMSEIHIGAQISVSNNGGSVEVKKNGDLMHNGKKIANVHDNFTKITVK